MTQRITELMVKANMDRMRKLAYGKRDWEKMLRHFISMPPEQFHGNVAALLRQIDNARETFSQMDKIVAKYKEKYDKEKD